MTARRARSRRAYASPGLAVAMTIPALAAIPTLAAIPAVAAPAPVTAQGAATDARATPDPMTNLRALRPAAGRWGESA